MAIIGTKNDMPLESKIVSVDKGYNMMEEINKESESSRCTIVRETSALEDFVSVETMLREVTQEIVRNEYFDSKQTNDLE